MLVSIEGCDEYTSLGISEWSPEVVEDGPLLGFKDNIKDGDKLWTAVGFIDSIFDGINEDNSDGNSEGFPIIEAVMNIVHLVYLNYLQK